MPSISPKYQKDYSNSNFKNPRLLQAEQSKKYRGRKIIFILAAIVTIGAIYFLIYSPYFRLQTVAVQGINKISEQRFTDIVNQYRYSRKYWIIPRNHFMFFSETGLKNTIGENYLLESLSVEKQWPRTIIINVVEKSAKIVYLANNLCYHVDQDGYAIEYCSDAALNLIRIKDMKTQSITIGQQAQPAEFIKYLLNAKQRLQEQLEPTLFIINQESPESIRVETANGFEVLMNRGLPVNEQIDRLYILLASQQVKDNLANIHYFDLRFGEKLYYQ